MGVSWLISIPSAECKVWLVLAFSEQLECILLHSVVFLPLDLQKDVLVLSSHLNRGMCECCTILVVSKRIFWKIWTKTHHVAIE